MKESVLGNNVKSAWCTNQSSDLLWRCHKIRPETADMSFICVSVSGSFQHCYTLNACCSVFGVQRPNNATADTGHEILTWRPLPFDAWRLQRPRLPFGVVPQLLMICSCFSARSARSSSSSMNCCSRTLALASRAAVSWRNWSIWATSLKAERRNSNINGYSL